MRVPRPKRAAKYCLFSYFHITRSFDFRGTVFEYLRVYKIFHREAKPFSSSVFEEMISDWRCRGRYEKHSGCFMW
ncbi:unnamed protein product [Cyprideis torosa]|uniref:Uncharacterized protein n=1 Tax=Cyprideis torosa TaxID=163714 RepID=A0A7R8WKZ8_9CRUS|nr:unnamed protein product [Cyprideis torosa]CAG0903770.1 unnamed protein product [Cyprideis torosa]